MQRAIVSHLLFIASLVLIIAVTIFARPDLRQGPDDGAAGAHAPASARWAGYSGRR